MTRLSAAAAMLALLCGLGLAAQVRPQNDLTPQTRPRSFGIHGAWPEAMVMYPQGHQLPASAGALTVKFFRQR